MQNESRQVAGILNEETKGLVIFHTNLNADHRYCEQLNFNGNHISFYYWTEEEWERQAQNDTIRVAQWRVKKLKEAENADENPIIQLINQLNSILDLQKKIKP